VDKTAAKRDPGQHDGLDGHLPPRQDNVVLISKLQLTAVPSGIADVTVFRDTAYLAAYTTPCGEGGVHVVDISDVENPEEIGFIPTGEGSFVGEGVQVTSVRTLRFRGDVLIFNNEICAESETAVGGATLVDVTDPANPRILAAGFGDFDTDGVPDGDDVADQVHSAFGLAGRTQGVRRAGRRRGRRGRRHLRHHKSPPAGQDRRVRPRRTVPADPAARPANPDRGLLPRRDREADRGAQVMVALYWDAGYVALDVSDPTRPRYIGDTDFTNPDPELLESTGEAQVPEGNGHQAEFTRDNEYLIGADEDFSPLGLEGRNLTDDTTLSASQGSDTPQLEPGEAIQGQTVFVGRACDTDPAVPPGDGSQVAVVERGECDFTDKLPNVERAGGYIAVLIFNREGSDACTATLGMSVEGDIPTFGVIPRDQGYALFDEPYDDEACLTGDGTETAPIPIGTVGDEVVFTSYFDGWGYVHLFDASTGTELDTYAIREAHKPRFASGFGALSVHEVATSSINPSRAYLSYYAGGFRVLDIRNNELAEVGSFIDRGGNNFWGVQVFSSDNTEYVAASDIDFGLYILKYTGGP